MINPKLAQALHDRYGVYHLSALTEQQATELAQILQGIGNKNIVISRVRAGEIKNILEYSVQTKLDLAKALPLMRDLIEKLDVLHGAHSTSFCSCLGYMTDKLSVKE